MLDGVGDIGGADEGVDVLVIIFVTLVALGVLEVCDPVVVAKILSVLVAVMVVVVVVVVILAVVVVTTEDDDSTMIGISVGASGKTKDHENTSVAL